jgi:hypothetical protein
MNSSQATSPEKQFVFFVVPKDPAAAKTLSWLSLFLVVFVVDVLDLFLLVALTLADVLEPRQFLQLLLGRGHILFEGLLDAGAPQLMDGLWPFQSNLYHTAGLPVPMKHLLAHWVLLKFLLRELLMARLILFLEYKMKHSLLSLLPPLFQE